jgi:hypothetical protein
MLKKLLLSVGLIASAAAASNEVEWPELPTSGFVSGRPATRDDIAKGNATFTLDGKSSGALSIKIPQYALWKDENGRDHAVILVQAELAPDGLEIVGLRNFDGTEIVATMPEITLLGTKKPN